MLSVDIVKPLGDTITFKRKIAWNFFCGDLVVVTMVDNTRSSISLIINIHREVM